MATEQASEETVLSRHERRRRETRERILRTALTLFGERGYEAVTIAEIADAADVAKQTVGNHFPAKEDLLLAWHRPVEADLIDMIEQLPLSSSLPEFLKEELPRMFARVPEQQAGPDPMIAGDERMGAVLTIIRDSPTLQEALRRRGARYQEDLTAILADRVPARLGPVAARAIAAFILASIGAVIEQATRLQAEGRSAKQINAALTDTIGKALDVLHTGVANFDVSGEPQN